MGDVRVLVAEAGRLVALKRGPASEIVLLERVPALKPAR
jgi:hypothetical protein